MKDILFDNFGFDSDMVVFAQEGDGTYWWQMANFLQKSAFMIYFYTLCKNLL